MRATDVAPALALRLASGIAPEHRHMASSPQMAGPLDRGGHYSQRGRMTKRVAE